ncbi:MAG: hypothetical protein Q8Q32_01785 [bacterium]|nr:hypothetical protein [bacterium]
MRIDIPFYSQNWDLDNWQALGYKNKDDAQYWERSSCGILCAKMAMDSFLSQRGDELTPPIKEIIGLGVKQGAFSDATGWSHQGLAKLIEGFGFKATPRTMNSDQLKEAIENNSIPIISIKWAFNNKKSLKERILFWKKYGGHLGVITGFEEENGKITGFYVHHTSKRKEQNWQNRLLPVKDFLKGYTGRGILVSE